MGNKLSAIFKLSDKKRSRVAVKQKNPYDASYRFLRELGEGGYGSVVLVEHTKRYTLHAMKVIMNIRCRRKTYCRKRKMYLPDEIVLWEKLEHDNILKLEAVYYDSGAWYMVMPYEHGFVDIFDYMSTNGILPDVVTRNILRQVVRISKYLVSQSVDHRDIKDENLLFNPKTGKVILIDFGSASVLTKQPYERFQGTPIYLPPEFYRDGWYYPESGLVWSIGCLAYSLLNGDVPFPTIDAVRYHQKLKFRNPFLILIAKNFLYHILESDPSRRITFDELLAHPFLF